MNLYNINQAAYKQLPRMSNSKIAEAIKDIEAFLESHDSNYYLMLNEDGRSYTIFTYNQEHEISKMANEIVDTAKSFGILKGIEILENMVEFWIQKDSECSLYAMFDYTQGVIEV